MPRMHALPPIISGRCVMRSGVSMQGRRCLATVQYYSKGADVLIELLATSSEPQSFVSPLRRPIHGGDFVATDSALYASWCSWQRAPRGKLLKWRRLFYKIGAHHAEVAECKSSFAPSSTDVWKLPTLGGGLGGGFVASSSNLSDLNQSFRFAIWWLHGPPIYRLTRLLRVLERSRLSPRMT